MTSGERAKYAVKVVVSHALYALGVLQLWQFFALRRKAVVLMYHRVLTSEEQSKTGSHPGIVVDRETFAKQMAVLARRFRVLSVEEFAERMERNLSFEDASCLITFDDGWWDNFTYALPILQRHRLPALVFLPVNFIGRRRLFWQEHFTHLAYQAVMQVRREPQCRDRVREILRPVHLEFVLDLPENDLRSAVMEAVRRQKGIAMSLVEDTLSMLTRELGGKSHEFEELDGFLDWDQVKSMAQHGISFGGHGAEHRLLDLVPVSEARDEINAARAAIDSRLQERTPTFSYPNGNWSPGVVDLVRESGYRMAFTTQPGLVKSDDDRFTIRRINVHESMTNSTPMFLARIVGLF